MAVLAGVACLALLLLVWRGGAPDDGPGATVEPVAEEPETTRRNRARDLPPETAPVPPRSIRVAVTSVDGTPIPGARVELVRGPASELLGSDFVPSVEAPAAEHTPVAGGDGAAVLGSVPPGRWFVVATAPGFGRRVLAGVTRGADEATLDASVALERAHQLAGTIRDRDGAPTAGISVILEPRRPSTMWPNDAACHRTRTSADGAYRFDGVEPGRYALWFVPREGVLVEDTTLLVPGVERHDTRMVRGAAIEGTVRDADTGAAIPGARVSAQQVIPARSSGDGDARTLLDTDVADRFGRFALQTWRARCVLTRLFVDADGYVPAPVAAGRDGVPGTVCEGQRFTFDLRLRRSVTMTGRVVGPDGPLAGVLVGVESDDVDAWPPAPGDPSLPNRYAWSRMTGSDGRYRVERLPAGPVRVFVFETFPGEALVGHREVDLGAGGDIALDIHVALRRVSVTCRVVDPEGRPIAGVDVAEDLGPFHLRSRTGADGNFTMEVVIPDDIHLSGAATLGLRRDGYCDARFFCSPAEDGQSIEMTPVRDIRGTIRRGDGTPVPGARVLLAVGFQGPHGFYSDWQGTRETVSGPDGTFTIALTGGPDHWLRVPVTDDWESLEEDEDGRVAVKVEAPVRIGGRVVAAGSGAPIAGALVRDDDDVVLARTDADGRFAVEAEAVNARGLRVVADGWVATPVAGDGTDQRITLVPAFAIAGVVRLADRTAVPGVMVSVRKADADRDADPDHSSATDASGRFVISGLDAGTYEVTVIDSVRYAHTSARATTTSGGEDLAFVVGPAVRLDLEVVGDDERHVKLADVTAVPEGAESAIDEGRADYYGRVTLALAPDRPHTLRVTCDGYAPAELRDVRGGGDAPLRIVLTRTPR